MEQHNIKTSYIPVIDIKGTNSHNWRAVQGFDLTMNIKKIITTAVKGLVSVLLLIYLFKKVDLREVWQLLQQVNVTYLFIALVLYTIGQVMCAYRWKILARLMDFHNSLKEFVVYYFAGMFFSLFLPTLIGGDVGKCYYLARGNKKTLQSVISVLADRGTGLIAVILISGFSLYLIDGFKIPEKLFWGVLAANVILIVLFLIPFFLSNHLSFLGKTISLSLTYWKSPWSLFKSILISFVFQLLIIVIHILIGLSLDLGISWKYYLFLIPLVTAASMLPVSFSGLGIREGAYVYFLSLVNISQPKAFTFAFGWFFVVLVSGLLGGLALFTKQVADKKLEVRS